MPRTMVRVYDTTVDDVKVRENEHVPGELVLDVGDVVSIHASRTEMRSILVRALNTIDGPVEFELVDESIDGGPF